MAMAVSGSISVRDAGRHGQVGDAQLRPDGQAADVDLERGRDVGRAGLDGQGEHLLVDQPVAVVDLERLTDEDDRHVGRDDFVPPYDLEVDVGDRLCHGMALHLAGQCQVGGGRRVRRERSWFAPASPFRAMRSSRAGTATGTGSVP